MKGKYKTLIKYAVALYLGFVADNVMSHYTNHREGARQSQRELYGPNLKKQWEGYAESELEKTTNAAILLPGSRFFNQTPEPAITWVGAWERIDGKWVPIEPIGVELDVTCTCEEKKDTE